MNKFITAAAVSAGILLSTPALARDVDVEITNLTNGLYFTPLLVAAHDRDTHLFQAGTMASESLQKMAEGGDLSDLIGDVDAAGGKYVVADPAGEPLAPGASATAKLKTKGRHNAYLSITGMLLPTNDGFVGLDALMIPKKRGTYTYLLEAYDAGTEANDELIVGMPGGAPGMPGIPGDPSEAGGSMGTGVAGADHNMKVHVHRGVIGDTDPDGGLSDLNRDVHRFNNPVAKVVVKVK
jgi:hypothetical protein